jgi:hypothetical protein
MDQTLDMRNIHSMGLAKLSFQTIFPLSEGIKIPVTSILTNADIQNVEILKYVTTVTFHNKVTYNNKINGVLKLTESYRPVRKKFDAFAGSAFRAKGNNIT